MIFTSGLRCRREEFFAVFHVSGFVEDAVARSEFPYARVLLRGNFLESSGHFRKIRRCVGKIGDSEGFRRRGKEFALFPVAEVAVVRRSEIAFGHARTPQEFRRDGREKCEPVFRQEVGHLEIRREVFIGTGERVFPIYAYEVRGCGIRGLFYRDLGGFVSHGNAYRASDGEFGHDDGSYAFGRGTVEIRRGLDA